MKLKLPLQRLAVAWGIILAAGFAPGGGAIAMPVLDFTGGTAGPAHPTTGDFTVGWVFDVNSAVTVNSLGIWDEGANGLGNGLQVGLWTIGGTLVASTTVTSASTAVASTSADGQWLFESIADVSLSVGRYAIAGVYDSNFGDFIRTDTIYSTVSEITYIQSTTAASGFNFPARFGAVNGGYLGPNLGIVSEVVTVPEPATLAVLGLGLAGLGFGMRKRG